MFGKVFVFTCPGGRGTPLDDRPKLGTPIRAGQLPEHFGEYLDSAANFFRRDRCEPQLQAIAAQPLMRETAERVHFHAFLLRGFGYQFPI